MSTVADPTFDIVIAGAGLPGLSLAAALSGCGLSVALTDRAAVIAPDVAAGEHDWDARVYAISPGSVDFLEGVGAWRCLPGERVQPIESMRIQGDAGATLEFTAYELRERALAWIVEERVLRRALARQVSEAPVALLAPRELESIDWSAHRATLHFRDGGKVHAHLVVGADGLRSRVREAAGILATPRPYGQMAVVANFTCEKAHHARAWQWFHADGGVLAWLPLPGRRISIVWSAPTTLGEALLQLSAPALAERVREVGEGVLGTLVPVTAAVGFALSHLELPSIVAHRVALIGDAAHGVHPLAGQGMNLGFGDARTLSSILRNRGPIDDPAAPLLLERYARQRAEPLHAMHRVTDGLARLFGTKVPGVRTIRNAGLAGLDRLPLVKRMLARPALR